MGTLTDAPARRSSWFGDDLFVTNLELDPRNHGGHRQLILIKVNQIGSLTENVQAVRKAHKAGYTTVMSHRSGETEDTTIADSRGRVEHRTDQNTGSLSARAKEPQKYNRLLRIEEELGKRAVYARHARFDRE